MVRRISEYDLSRRNTFGMKVRCACFVEYDSVSDLKAIDFASLPGPVVHIGEGSNLLFTGDFPGTVLHSRIDYVKYFDVGGDRVPVAAGAGVKWDDFVAKTCADGLWGAENLSAIPGEVGAAAVQNIGAYGVEVKDIISGVTCYDTVTGEKTAFKVAQCRYAYRDSIFKSPGFKGRYIVTGVLFLLNRKPSPRLDYGKLREAFPSGAPQTPLQLRDAVKAIRSQVLPDPAVTGSAGSFFKNPVVTGADLARISQGRDSVPHFDLGGGMFKIPAAWMIEQCGLKGASLGGAEVYGRQPLVIVNRSGDATPQDILGLESRIIEKVWEKFGVELTPEVEHI